MASSKKKTTKAATPKKRRGSAPKMGRARLTIAITTILLASCDTPTSSSSIRHGDACIALADRAIGACMDTKGAGAVDEARVRFCTEQYVSIVLACRCERDDDDVAAPDPAPNDRLPEVP